MKRIFKPLYIPVICLVASLLIFISKDNYNYNIIRIILFSLGMIFLITSEVSIRYSGLDDIKSLIFVATPISIIFIIYSIIFKQTLFRSNA